MDCYPKGARPEKHRSVLLGSFFVYDASRQEVAKVATTQQLKVHIDVPQAAKGGNEMINVGCVGILVGFME